MTRHWCSAIKQRFQILFGNKAEFEQPVRSKPTTRQTLIVEASIEHNDAKLTVNLTRTVVKPKGAIP